MFAQELERKHTFAQMGQGPTVLQWLLGACTKALAILTGLMVKKTQKMDFYLIRYSSGIWA